MKLKFWNKMPSLSIGKNIKKKRPYIVLHEVVSAALIAVKALMSTVIGVQVGTAVYGLTVATIIKASLIVGAAFYSMSAAKKAKLSGQSRDYQASGHLINTRSSSEPLPIVYGDCRIGGNIVYINATGTNNEYLHIVMTVSEGPVEGIVTDELLTLDVAPGGTGWAVGDTITGSTSGKTCEIVVVLTTLTYIIKNRSGNFTLGEILSNGVNPADQGAAHPTITAIPMIWLDDRRIQEYGTDAAYEFFTGTSTQSVCATLQGYDANWDDAMPYTAYIYVRLHYNEDLYASVPQITMRLKGRLLYDPRDASTAWSDNNALVAYDFLRNDRYSIGISASFIDNDSVNDLANWCDTNGYTFNGVIINRQAFIDNMDDILRNCRSAVVWSEGEYKLFVYDYDTPVMTLTEDDIVQDSLRIIVPGIPETPNRCIVAYIDAVDNYLSKTRIIEDPAAVLTYDQEERDFNLDLIGTTSAEYAEKLGAYYVDRNRLNYQFSFTAHARALALDPMDMVKITHFLPGWDEAILRVTDVDYDQDGHVKLTVLKENSDLYDDTVNVETHNAYETNLPSAQLFLQEGHTTILPWNYNAIIQGTWVFALSANEIMGGVFYNSTKAQNDEINYKIYMAAGTHNFSVTHRKDVNSGILTLYIDGVSQGTIDMYAGVISYNNISSIANISIEMSGLKTVTLKAATKNVLSGGYQLDLNSLAFYRAS